MSCPYDFRHLENCMVLFGRDEITPRHHPLVTVQGVLGNEGFDLFTRLCVGVLDGR